MGLKKFQIILDQPVYYAGQLISGRLIVEVDKPKSTRGIYLKYCGEAHVYWTERHRRNQESYTVTYSNAEYYLGLQQLVFGNDTEDCELAEGEHVFLFNCQLPINLPSSFEGHGGRIRYSVIATINRSWKFNHVTKQPITIVSVYDLNTNSLAISPVEEQTSKTFWGHSNKQLYMFVKLPVRGFVPGQILPIKVSINNESGVRVKSIYISLEQYVTLHATAKSKTMVMYVFQNEFPIPEGFGCEEVPLNLQLPALPPSYLEFCRIIDLKYVLHVQTKVHAWYHRNLSVRTELIVGNIPVMSYQRPVHVQQLLGEHVDQDTPSSSQAPDHQPPAYGFVAPPGSTYADLPPPTYEQSIGLGRSDNEKSEYIPDSDGEVTLFSPLYPVYNFKTNE